MGALFRVDFTFALAVVFVLALDFGLLFDLAVALAAGFFRAFGSVFAFAFAGLRFAFGAAPARVPVFRAFALRLAGFFVATVRKPASSSNSCNASSR